MRKKACGSSSPPQKQRVSAGGGNRTSRLRGDCASVGVLWSRQTPRLSSLSLLSRGRQDRGPWPEIWLLGIQSSGSVQQNFGDREVFGDGTSRPLRRSTQAVSAFSGRCGRPFGGQPGVTLVPRRPQLTGLRSWWASGKRESAVSRGEQLFVVVPALGVWKQKSVSGVRFGHDPRLRLRGVAGPRNRRASAHRDRNGIER